MRWFIVCLLALAGRGVIHAGTPEELGEIEWGRDYAAAVKASRKSGKPLLVLFDEVPGCMTCKRFGRGPLSHPLIVAAAREFEAVAVYNNVGGMDRQILKRFREPSWNNPVVRFLDSAGNDLIRRKAGVYDTGELASRLILALKAAKRPVPKYLELLAAEYNAKQQQRATFSMYCYWTGEKNLGAIEGVTATKIGHLQGREVVEVEYDAAKLTFNDLLKRASRMRCAQNVMARSDNQAKAAATVVGARRVIRTDAAVNTNTTQQYNLSFRPEYYYLPLTRLQATRANAAVAAGRSADSLLSPGQLALKKQIAGLSRTQKAKLKRNLQPDRSPGGIIAYRKDLLKFLD